MTKQDFQEQQKELIDKDFAVLKLQKPYSRQRVLGIIAEKYDLSKSTIIQILSNSKYRKPLRIKYNQNRATNNL